MATIVEANVIFPSVTTLPKDVSINVLHFLGPDDGDPDVLFPDLSAIIEAFYNDRLTSDDDEIDGFGIRDFLSPMISRQENACRIAYYDAQANPKVLLNEHQWTLGHSLDTTPTPLPNELAVCASITATPGGAVPIRRRRGRVYLGPLNTTGMGERTEADIVDYPSVSSQMRKVVAALCQRMAEDLTVGISWAIYSRVNDEAYAVTGGFIDNDYDIQRRRQVDATSRTTWGALP